MFDLLLVSGTIAAILIFRKAIFSLFIFKSFFGIFPVLQGGTRARRCSYERFRCKINEFIVKGYRYLHITSLRSLDRLKQPPSAKEHNLNVPMSAFVRVGRIVRSFDMRSRRSTTGQAEPHLHILSSYRYFGEFSSTGTSK